MKQSAVFVATLALLAGALYLGRGGPRPTVQSATSPAGCLERMFRAAEQGDVPTYLDCFTGQQRDRLVNELNRQSEADFAASLLEAVRTLKGRAISGPTDTAPDASRATLAVERIYGQHTERQRYHFLRETDGWRIASVDAVEKLRSPIPYGTPVYELEPSIRSPESEL